MNNTTRLSNPSVHVALDNQLRRKRFFPRVFASLVLVVFTSLTSVAFAQNVLLGTAGDFGVLASSAVTNTGSTVISGSVGVYAGTSISGFPPGLITPLTGSFHSADAVALQAQSDLTIAYNDAAGRPCGEHIAGDTLGGLTRSSGVYCLGVADLTGTITLDGPGVYIFKATSSLVTASNSSVNLINGASACDVFWQVTSSATLGTGSAIAGTIMALASITMNTGASLTGGALARTGAVTLDGNDVTTILKRTTLMNSTKMLALVLIVAGALALAYGGFTYTTDTHSADMGPIHMSVDEKEHVNIPIWAGIGVLVLGGVLLMRSK